MRIAICKRTFFITIPALRSLSAGFDFTCAINPDFKDRRTGHIVCWGTSLVPVLSRKIGFGHRLNAVCINLGMWHHRKLNGEDGLRAPELSSMDPRSPCAPRSYELRTSRIAAVSAGAYHACAVTTAGVLDCWGQAGAVPGVVSG